MVPAPLNVDGHQVQANLAAVVPVNEQVAHQAGRKSWPGCRTGPVTEPSQALIEVLGAVKE